MPAIGQVQGWRQKVVLASKASAHIRVGVEAATVKENEGAQQLKVMPSL